MANIIDYQLPGGAKEIYDYTSMNKGGTFTTSATANTFTTVLSVTGKGVLHKAMTATAGSTAYRDIKVTIDGTVVYWGSGNSNVQLCQGLLREDHIIPLPDGTTNRPAARIGADLYYLKSGSNASQEAVFPSTSKQTGTYGTFFPLSKGIRFNTSLLIEVASTNTSDTLPISIIYDI